MPEEYCCPNCFDDSGIAEDLIPIIIDNLDSTDLPSCCSFCKDTRGPFVPPSCLKQWFDLVIDCYTIDSFGKSLVDIISSDWGVLSSLETSVAKRLLESISGGDYEVNKKFSPRVELAEDENGDLTFLREETWDALREEVMHKNHWFHDNELQLEYLANAFQNVAFSEAEESSWYRCRIARSGATYQLKDMGAPPRDKVKYGRVNPSGIQCLYLASDTETAIAEVRPHAGETVYVAEGRGKLEGIVDLCNPRSRVSPFTLQSSSEIMKVRNDLSFLRHLGVELSSPVQPSSSSYEYIPSQYLCEFIKYKGFNGILYKSSVCSTGKNLALFNPNWCDNFTNLRSYQISTFSVSICEKNSLCRFNMSIE